MSEKNYYTEIHPNYPWKYHGIGNEMRRDAYYMMTPWGKLIYGFEVRHLKGGSHQVLRFELKLFLYAFPFLLVLFAIALSMSKTHLFFIF